MSGAAVGKRKAGSAPDWILLTLAILAAGVLVYHGCLRFYRAAYPIGYRETVERECGRNGLPPALVYAVIRTESGFNPLAQSGVPARGLMQITRETFEWAQLRLGEEGERHFDDLFDGGENIRYGAAILRLLLDEFGTESNALCAYHAGWGVTQKWLRNPEYAPDGENIERIPYGDTSRYVKKVLETKKAYETLYGDIVTEIPADNKDGKDVYNGE